MEGEITGNVGAVSSAPLADLTGRDRRMILGENCGFGEREEGDKERKKK